MTTEEYDDFARSREFGRLSCAGFARLTAHNLAGTLVVSAPSKSVARPESVSNKVLSVVVRFLAKLCADCVSEIVELANRSAHGGELLCRTQPIAPRHYRTACTQLLAAARKLAEEAQKQPAPAATGRGAKRPRASANDGAPTSG